MDRTERHDRMLGELADLAMDLARDMAAKAKKADSLEDAERYTLAFDRMARSVRLSISLSRRLERDAARDHAQRHAEVVDLKKAKLRARLRSEICESETHWKARCDLERELDETLAEDALYQRFLDLPLDEVIQKLRSRLGLVPPPQGEGEGDREAVEGVPTHSRLRGLQPPQSAALTAPPPGRLATRPPELRSSPPEGVELGEQLGRFRPAPS